MPEDIPRNQILLAFSPLPPPPKSHVGPKGRKRNWGMCREFPLQDSLSTPPVPNSVSISPPTHVFFILPLRPPLSFPQQPSSLSAFPAPLSPHPLIHVPFSTLLPLPPIPFPPTPQWGGGPGGPAPSPARLRQRWWRLAVSLPLSGCRCQGGDRIWGCPSPGRWRGGGSGRLGPYR